MKQTHGNEGLAHLGISTGDKEGCTKSADFLPDIKTHAVSEKIVD
jgi:hypothetical protein